MMPAINQITLAVGGSPAASILVKVTAATALGLIGAWLARGSRAAVRHALLAATFGVLLALPVASFVAPPLRIVLSAQERIVPVIATDGAVTLPFEPAPASSGAASSNPRSARLTLSAILFAGWIAGAVLFLLPMALGLWQVRSLRRSGLPWRHGQSVVETLALDTGIQRRVDVLLHQALPGPMTCGIVHPAIVLPSDARCWEEEDLTRALLHELEHVRRGDWLTQCLARAVCAMYWFHPLVWVAWRQLSLEAERSCDDAVLGRSEATAYAGQLVGLARRLSANTKPALLAMASRADLAARVGAVLDVRQRRGRAGILPVALVCAAAAVLVIVMSPLTVVAAPQAAPAQSAPPEFDAVSVKLIDPNMRGEHSSEHSDRGRLTMTGTMHRFLVRAYGITDGQLGGEPDWFTTRLYSIEAVTSAPSNSEQMMLMLRKALADRFQLKLRQEDRDLPVFVLEVAAGGPKFKELKPGEVPHDPPDAPDIFARSFSSVQSLINTLNGVFGGIVKLDHTVVDRTQLTGRYDIQLRTEMEIQTDDFGRSTWQLPNLSRDLQSELGLKLVPDHVKMPYFVVEQAAAPSPN
jgi:uncharacterized protein (TIGR03435 family)